MHLAVSSFDFRPLRPLLPRLDGVVNDLDGTLIINNEKQALTQIGDVIKAYLNDQYGLQDDRDYCIYAGKPLPEIRKEVEAYHRTKGNIVKLPSHLDDTIKAIRAQTPLPDEQVIVHPFFRGLIDLFHQNGVFMSIATGSEPCRAYRYVQRAGLEIYFPKKVIFSGHKPEPTCYLEAIYANPRYPTESDARFERIISFEDSLSGVRAGLRAGVHVIGHVLAHHISEGRKKLIAAEMKNLGAAAVIMKDEDCIPALHHVLAERIAPRRQRVFAFPQPRPASSQQKVEFSCAPVVAKP